MPLNTIIDSELGPQNTPKIHYIRSPPTYLPKNQEISLGHKHKHQVRRQIQSSQCNRLNLQIPNPFNLSPVPTPMNYFESLHHKY